MEKQIFTSFNSDELRSLIEESLEKQLPKFLNQQPATPEISDGFYTRQEAADRLRISLATLHKRLKLKEIDCVRLGRRVLIPRDFIDNMFERSQQDG